MQKSKTVSIKSVIPSTEKISSSQITLVSVLLKDIPKKKDFYDNLAVELGFAKLEDIHSKDKPKSMAITKNTFKRKRMELAYSYEAYTKLKKRLYALQNEERVLPISLTGKNIHHVAFGLGEVINLTEAGVLVAKFGTTTMQLELLTCLEEHYISFADPKAEAAVLSCFKPLLEARKLRSKYLVSVYETEIAIKEILKALYKSDRPNKENNPTEEPSAAKNDAATKEPSSTEEHDATPAEKAIYLYSLYKAKKLTLESMVYGIDSITENFYMKKTDKPAAL